MNKSVVITGVSTGIGYQLCVDLISKNYFVFGSVRKLEDGQVDDVLPGDNEDREAVRGMASPETREVVRSALRKVARGVRRLDRVRIHSKSKKKPPTTSSGEHDARRPSTVAARPPRAEIRLARRCPVLSTSTTRKSSRTSVTA